MSDLPGRPRRGRWGRGFVLGVCSALCWFAWFAWDRTYQMDPVTKVSFGPYETWQVLGAVVTLVVLASIGAMWAGARGTIVSLAIGFTAAWSATARSYDDTGTSGVGAILVLAGVALGSALVTLVVTSLVGRRPSSPA